jgi:Gpi18-like mannosyltransferase
MPTDTGNAHVFARMRSWFFANPERRSLCRIFVYLFAIRVLLCVVALFATQLAGANLHPRAERYVGAFAAWVRWDSFWYVAIADEGYSYSVSQASNVAFLPGFPLSIRALTVVIRNPFVAGLIVSHLASLAAIVAFWRWVRERAGLHAAERAVLWLVVFPYSFFFYSIYSEGLYFLLCTLALREADRERWAHAGIWGTLAALTRPMGVLLVPAFAWAILQVLRSGVRPRPVMAMAALPAVGLAAYALYLWQRFGDPFAVITAQNVGWKAEPTWNIPGRALENLLQMWRRPETTMKIHGLVQALLPVALILLVVRTWRRLGGISGVYAGLTVLIVVLFGLESIGRESLAAVPLFAALGLGSPSGRDTFLRLTALALMIILCFSFTRGRFMG